MNKKLIATVVALSMVLGMGTGCNIITDLPSLTEETTSAAVTEPSESETSKASETETTESESKETETEPSASDSTETTDTTAATSDASESVESGVTRGSDETETSVTAESSETSASSEDTSATSASYEEIYSGLLETAYDILTKGPEDDIPEGFTGIMEIYNNFQSEAVNNVGYRIDDVTGDGVPELIIGTNNTILALYTIKDGKEYLAIEGWMRSSEQMLSDGSFYMSGSAGAAAHIFGRYTLSSDGTTKTWSDCYFTDVKDDQTWEIGIYHNKTGDMDKEHSEELHISSEDLTSIEEGYYKKVTELNLKPIAFAVAR